MSERETMNVAETKAVQEAEIALDELVEISTNLFETYWVKIGHEYLAGRTYCMRINRVNRPRGRWYIASYSQFIKDHPRLHSVRERRGIDLTWGSS
jgi:hypothetical protein